MNVYTWSVLWRPCYSSEKYSYVALEWVPTGPLPPIIRFYFNKVTSTATNRLQLLQPTGSGGK